jgi:hypothetical protein
VGGVGEQRLRHINDSVLSSLKMEGIRFYIYVSIDVANRDRDITMGTGPS